MTQGAPTRSPVEVGYLRPLIMGFAHFIARRIVRGNDNERSGLSRPIVLIAVLGIVIGMAVMILTVGISTGFQREIRAKVSGAGSHIEIVQLAQRDPKDPPRMPIAQPFYPWLDTVPGVAWYRGNRQGDPRGGGERGRRRS
jgi:lipoprotein-releasing system permease protein